ncbi:MAG: hypothetical protein WBD36_09995 [Bacteroidota bacterium]
MKSPILLILSVAVLFSCKKNDPVSPEPPLKTIVVSAYGEALDSLYFKMWSDSSWSKYGGTVVISGALYAIEVTNDGYESYYSETGFAGFKAAGDVPILFDKPMTNLPDTLAFGEAYTRQTTFSYRGYPFTMANEQTLVDTVSVSVPFGLFNPCLHFTSKVTVSANGQSEVQNIEFWIARGPGTIKQASGTLSVVMVRGIVNGQGWGMADPGTGRLEIKQPDVLLRFATRGILAAHHARLTENQR